MDMNETWSKEDLAYLAGFVDGEGCVSWVHRHNRPPDSIRFEIRVSNTNIWVLQWIYQRFGGHLGLIREKKRPLHWKKVYQWYIADNKAKALYKELKPYLKIK